MCLDFVAQVIGREGDLAVVESEGRRWQASTLLMPDTAPGDWVRVALGTVLERLDAVDAAAINEELRAAQRGAS